MTLSTRRRCLIATPLLLAALLAFHPRPAGTRIYDGLQDHVTPWLTVHLGLALGACLMGVVLYQLLRGMTGMAASVSRVATVLFVAFFIAWEAMLGIGTGVLVDYANGLPAGAERDAVADAIQDLFMNPITGDVSVLGTVANGAWIVAVVAAAFAVRRAGAGLGTAILLCLASLFTLHAVVIGPIGLVCFAAAALLLLERTGVRSSVNLATPHRPRRARLT